MDEDDAVRVFAVRVSARATRLAKGTPPVGPVVPQAFRYGSGGATKAARGVWAPTKGSGGLRSSLSQALPATLFPSLHCHHSHQYATICSTIKLDTRKPTEYYYRSSGHTKFS